MNLEQIRQNCFVGECWLWRKSCNSTGYGQINVKGRHWNLHRLVYTLVHGEIPKGLLVRHSCHNRLCCNPAHLSVGTHKDNYYDSIEVHTAATTRKRGLWEVEGVSYETVRAASAATGIHQQTLCKYTECGVFNIEKYLKGCAIAAVTPKLGTVAQLVSAANS